MNMPERTVRGSNLSVLGTRPRMRRVWDTACRGLPGSRWGEGTMNSSQFQRAPGQWGLMMNQEAGQTMA